MQNKGPPQVTSYSTSRDVPYRTFKLPVSGYHLDSQFSLAYTQEEMQAFVLLST